MKFYDRSGKKHKTIVGALFSDGTNAVDKKLEETIPGYSTFKESTKKHIDSALDSIDDALGSANATLDDMLNDANERERKAFSKGISDQVYRKVVINYDKSTIKLIDQFGVTIAELGFDETITREFVDEMLNNLLHCHFDVTEEDRPKQKGKIIDINPTSEDEDPVVIEPYEDDPLANEPYRYKCQCGYSRAKTYNPNFKCDLCGTVVSNLITPNN